MSKFLVKAVLLFLFLLFLYFYAQSWYSLISKNYFIDEAKLYKLDTFHLYNRAYETIDGRKWSSKSQLQFQSTDGYSFAIQKNFFYSIRDRQQLKDVLLCDDNAFVPNTTVSHDVAFVPYTTKQYYDEFKSTPYPIFIKVYQIQIGNKKYIDIKEANALNKSSLVMHLTMPTIILLLATLIITVKPIKQKISKLIARP